MSNESYFHDPIYGHVYLSPIERSIVDTLEFQRLRFIRQNSLLHYVFPGAFHTRFSHSIGVCHNSHRILQRLFPWIEKQEFNYCLQITRLAALLHDVGHGAFSHLLPYVRVGEKSFLPHFQVILDKPQDWGIDTPHDSAILAGLKKGFEGLENRPIEHEAFSVLIIQKLFGQLRSGTRKHSGDELLLNIPSQVWAQDVAALILPTIKPTSTFLAFSEKLVEGYIKKLPHLKDTPIDTTQMGSSLIKVLASTVSGTVDADRMDYLLRDSSACGVNYGLYDYDGLISALQLIVEDGKFVLGLNSKRTNTLDDFLWSRFQMFKQVYCHKTHSAYNLLLSRAMDDLASNDIIRPPNNLPDYLKLTDDFVMSRVFEETQNNPQKNNWVKAFATRQLPKLLGTFEASLKDKVWEKDHKDIYSELNFEKYEGWEKDPHFVTLTQKAEVVRVKDDEATLPTIVHFDKNTKTYHKDSYLDRSVFYTPSVPSENQLDELGQRLNKKILFFFQLRS